MCRRVLLQNFLPKSIIIAPVHEGILSCYFVKVAASIVKSCLSVCLSARISEKPHVPTLPDCLCMLHGTVARSFSSGVVMSYVLPVLWMTSCFITGPMAADVTTVTSCNVSCTSQHLCCVVLVESCPQRSSRINKSLLQWVPVQGKVYDAQFLV